MDALLQETPDVALLVETVITVGGERARSCTTKCEWTAPELHGLLGEIVSSTAFGGGAGTRPQEHRERANVVLSDGIGDPIYIDLSGVSW